VVIGEPRWHMASAVVAAIILTILLPDDVRLGPSWLLPLIEGALLVALIAGDPGKIDRRSAPLRALSIGLVSALVFGALWATAVLTAHLIDGGREPSRPTCCRKPARSSGRQTSSRSRSCTGSWTPAEQRRGRTGRRPATSTSRSPADEPSLTVAHWRPRFIDYLYLGFTNATAFSPTDAMPLAPWAKITMTVQALISLVILGLVIARAVNVFA
jgi:hypothetical protein